MEIEDYFYPFLGAYFASPQWIKNSVGRAYSMISKSFRQGPHYKQFAVEAAICNENKIRVLSSMKLAKTLRWAIESVPAYGKYRHLLSHMDMPIDVLRALPLVSKDDIKRDVIQFLSINISPKQQMKTFTGGSTSTPMSFFLHKNITRIKEYAFIESFQQRIGFDESTVVLALRGRTVPNAAKQPGGSLWMYEPIKKQLVLSSDHLERTYMAAYIAAIRAWNPTYIQAYPSALYPLARWLKENPAPDVMQHIKGIMLFSENVFDYHMSLFKEVFSCPVLKHYGHSERVLMAASMPDDERYFFWPQYGYFELVDEAGRLITQPGILGEIVGTGFDNQVMPFVRYRTGDMAMLSDRPHPLLPGYPVIERIEGRRQEFIVCHDRRLIGVCGMGSAHSGDLAEVETMQYEQREPGHLYINVVTSSPLSAEARQRIIHGMEAKTQGGCTVELVQLDRIARTLRGKHQLLIQHLDISQYLGVPENGIGE